MSEIKDIDNVTNIPMIQIFSDKDFNCRGQIYGSDIADLATSIEKVGLQAPIVVQPFEKDDDPNIKYRIIMGHRRHAAFKALRRETIPGFVRSGLTEFDARVLNLVENLKRTNLNPVQEARAILPLIESGTTYREIAQQLGKSVGWVQLRLNILDLPEQIQEFVAKEYFTQAQIKDLHYTMQSDGMKALIEKANAIRDKKLFTDAKIPKTKKITKKDLKKAVPPKKEDILQIMDAIGQSLGYGLATRCLAYSLGTISEVDIHLEIQEACKAEDIDYALPMEIRRALNEKNSN